MTEKEEEKPDLVAHLLENAPKGAELIVPEVIAVRTEKLSLSERFADAVTSTLGSWQFIAGQSAFLAAWIVLNSTDFVPHWDPYPFTLCNLALSFQAAYTGSFVLISQARQAAKDRQTAQSDYETDLECAFEIKALHQKIDMLLAMVPEAQKQAFIAQSKPAAALPPPKPQ